MKLLYNLYQLFIAFPLLLLATILTALVTSVGCLLGSAHFWGYYPAKIWGMLFCRILLLPVKIVGHEHINKKTSYVFVANHQGAFDIFLILGFLGRNFKWMMKKSLRKAPLIGRACYDAGYIFVDKSGPKKIKETIDRARNILQGGTSLVVFPEGARSYTGEMIPFKKGAFQLADQLQLPIVPLTITGSFQVFPRTRKFGFITYHPLTLTIHQPIPPQSEGVENIKQTMNKAYEIIDKELHKEK
ncbi:MAG: 1-acyl-sn-glycerol-3-phosphate acyltransferase [Bacteroidaceae bacterium]|nr:1-acyl-sn-glycerol-3-phosphate acyltransferase [Bacteroidaceae bacterium]